MKDFLSKVGVAVTLFALAVALTSLSVQAAEKKKISGVSKTKRLISQTVSYPGDDPRHMIVQTVREEKLTSSDADWNDLDVLMIEQADRLAGSGAHKGYLTITHKNGDETYIRFEGANKMDKDGKDWEVSSEGKLQITGGTGKFKDAKGTGSYTGKATAKGSVVNWEVDAEY